MWDALNPRENPLPSSLYARHWLSRSPLAENEPTKGRTTSCMLKTMYIVKSRKSSSNRSGFSRKTLKNQSLPHLSSVESLSMKMSDNQILPFSIIDQKAFGSQ